MSWRLTMLGTGSAFAKRFYNNNALLEINNKRVLLDCGHTAWRALAALGLGINDVDGVLLTHLHADHVGGLEEAAFQARYVARKKLTLFLPTALSDLWEVTLRGGLRYTDEGEQRLTDYFDVVWLPNDWLHHTGLFDLWGLPVRTVRTQHVPGLYSCGYLLGHELWYSGDTRFDAELVTRVAARADVLYHDAQLWQGGIHASLQELATLPMAVRQRLWLMHYGDEATLAQPHLGMRWLRQGVTQTLGT